ncbi:MAG: adenylate/guanylate cyclase domain-containing protein [Planctomycetota bacterium]
MTDSGSRAARVVGLLMADVVGSTTLYESIGDAAARPLVQSCMDLLIAQVVRHGGRVVKTMGDGVLCTFPSAEQAARAACAMSDAVATHALAVRIAVHFGEVIEHNDDVFGDAVNTLSRIAGLATPGELLLSRATFERLADLAPWRPRPLPPVPVKGKREPLELVALLRPVEGRPLLRSTVGGGGGLAAVVRSMVLSYGHTELPVDAEHPVDLGRDPSNTIVVDSVFASRLHARVFCEGELVILQDRSSNGTWVATDGQEPVQILRRQTPLYGCGRIFVGADPRQHLTMPVLFRSG